MVASCKGHPGVVRTLLHSGATVNSSTQVDALVVHEAHMKCFCFCKDYCIVNVQPHVWQFKSPYIPVEYIKYPHLSLVPRPSHSSIFSSVFTHPSTCTPTPIFTHTHMYTHIYTHTHTHTHINNYTHRLGLPLSMLQQSFNMRISLNF